jgi:hypothetical protein
MSLVEANKEQRPVSPAAVLQAMEEPPHLSTANVHDLDAAIAAGRLATRPRDLFSD